MLKFFHSSLTLDVAFTLPPIDDDGAQLVIKAMICQSLEGITKKGRSFFFPTLMSNVQPNKMVCTHNSLQHNNNNNNNGRMINEGIIKEFTCT